MKGNSDFIGLIIGLLIAVFVGWVFIALISPTLVEFYPAGSWILIAGAAAFIIIIGAIVLAIIKGVVQ